MIIRYYFYDRRQYRLQKTNKGNIKLNFTATFALFSFPILILWQSQGVWKVQRQPTLMDRHQKREYCSQQQWKSMERAYEFSGIDMSDFNVEWIRSPAKLNSRASERIHLSRLTPHLAWAVVTKGEVTPNYRTHRWALLYSARQRLAGRREFWKWQLLMTCSPKCHQKTEENIGRDARGWSKGEVESFTEIDLPFCTRLSLQDSFIAVCWSSFPEGASRDMNHGQRAWTAFILPNIWMWSSQSTRSRCYY